jgi:hypothetical protein
MIEYSFRGVFREWYGADSLRPSLDPENFAKEQ